jgi:hypothetical protein
MNLSCIDLQNANLEGAKLKGTDLSCANLEGANLRNVVANNVKLNGAYLPDAKLQGSQFEFADLRSARMQGDLANSTNFAYADFTGADMRAMQVGHANFYSAKFQSTNANGTDFVHAGNFSFHQFRVNVETARRYYTKYIHMHVNYYGKCYTQSNTCNPYGQCSTSESASNTGSCTGFGEFIPDSYGFRGYSGMYWSHVINNFIPGIVQNQCTSAGFGMDRLLAVTFDDAWLCGLIDRRWNWAIIRRGDLHSKTVPKVMESGMDPTRPGEPGGAMRLHLGYTSGPSGGLNGFVLDLKGYVHIG